MTISFSLLSLSLSLSLSFSGVSKISDSEQKSSQLDSCVVSFPFLLFQFLQEWYKMEHGFWAEACFPESGRCQSLPLEWQQPWGKGETCWAKKAHLRSGKDIVCPTGLLKGMEKTSL